MKNVILGTILVVLIITITQVRARESSSLDSYYNQYLNTDYNMRCKKLYGNDVVKYFETVENVETSCILKRYKIQKTQSKNKN